MGPTTSCLYIGYNIETVVDLVIYIMTVNKLDLKDFFKL